MSDRALTRREIGELADRLRGLLDMVETGEMSASKAMTYRMQGAVAELDAVLGHHSSLLDSSGGRIR
jgi:hypothetical protein